MPVYLASRVGFQHARSSSVLIQNGSDPADETFISKDFISIWFHKSAEWESTEEC